METNETITTQSPVSMRPTFLTVICILTFIGSGWGVISAAKSYLTAEATASMVSEKVGQAEDKMNSDAPGFLKGILGSASAMANPGTIRESSIFSFVSCLLSLVGAILMWSLKKNGFYLYIAGIILSIAAPIIVVGGTLGAISAGGAVVIGLIFIIMYGLNLKYMS